MRIRLLFILITFLSTPFLAVSQCTPDAAVSSRGVYPATLPVACLNSAYEQTITVVAPVDSVVQGFTVPIDSMKLGLVGNLPLGFTADCGSSTCTGVAPTFTEPAKECIRLVGLPSAALANDTVFIPVTYYVTIFGFPVLLEEEVYVVLEIFQPDTSISVVGTTLISQATSATYRWLDCCNGMSPILNATGPSFTAVNTGIYAVEVTQNGCVGISNCYTLGGLSVNELLAGQVINIFPNPTKGSLNVDLREVNQTTVLRVFNAIGKLVYQQNLNSNTMGVIQLDFPGGVYNLQLTTKAGESVRHSVILQN